MAERYSPEAIAAAKEMMEVQKILEEEDNSKEMAKKLQEYEELREKEEKEKREKAMEDWRKDKEVMRGIVEKADTSVSHTIGTFILFLSALVTSWLFPATPIKEPFVICHDWWISLFLIGILPLVIVMRIYYCLTKLTTHKNTFDEKYRDELTPLEITYRKKIRSIKKYGVFITMLVCWLCLIVGVYYKTYTNSPDCQISVFDHVFDFKSSAKSQ